MTPNRRSHRRLLLSLGAVTVVFAAAACGGKSSGDSGAAVPAGAPYTIGVINTVSTNSGVTGQAEQDGMQFALDKVNASGGVNGHPIAINLIDDQGAVSQATTAFQRLATSDRVPLILGPGLTATSEAVAPLAKRYNIADVNLVSVTSFLAANPNVFEVAPVGEVNAEAMISYLRSKGITSAFLLASTTAYGQAGQAAIQKYAQQLGFTISAVDNYAPNAVDFTAQASRIAQAKPAAVLLYASGSSVDGQVLKAIRNSGYTGLAVGDLGFTLGTIPPVAGDATRNLVGLSPLNYTATSGPTADFVRTYRAKTGKYPTTTSAYGYEAMMVAVEAIKKAGSFDNAAILKAMNSLDYTGVYGKHDYQTSRGGPSGVDSYTPVSFAGSDYVPAS